MRVLLDYLSQRIPGRNNRSDTYFVTLVGAASGTAAWFLMRAVIFMQLMRGAVWANLLACVLLGVLVPASCISMIDHQSGNRIVFRWVAMTGFIGSLAGLGAGVLIGVVNKASERTPGAFRIVAWILLGLLIGAVIGFTRKEDEQYRGLYSALGGLGGGVLGALAFAGLGTVSPGFNEAAGYALLGAGIAFGLTYARPVVRTATLRFVESDDPKTRNTVGKSRKAWTLDEERQYVIGSMAPREAGRRSFSSVDIYLPDPLVAARHATIYFRRGRPFIAMHEENRDGSGARLALFVGGRAVSQPSPLEDRDEIKLGRTILRLDLRTSRNDGPGD